MKTPPVQKRPKQPSAFRFFERFSTEEKAREYMESARWPNGILCAKCGHNGAYKIRGGKQYTCKACRNQFTIKSGTVMEDSKIPVRKWLYAMYLVSVSRKGISSIQLSKEIGVTQKSAWFMLGRLREACKMQGRVGGVVEADETFIGGIERNRHRSKRTGKRGPAGTKIAVVGVRSRNGEFRAEALPGYYGAAIRKTVYSRVTTGSTLYTDDHTAYRALRGYNQASVCHSRGEYVRGKVHTNSIESMWALLKRGHMGTYHHWSAKHLQRYIDEFVFRLSTKGLPVFDEVDDGCGINVVRMMVVGMESKKLTYRMLIK